MQPTKTSERLGLVIVRLVHPKVLRVGDLGCDVVQRWISHILLLVVEVSSPKSAASGSASVRTCTVT